MWFTELSGGRIGRITTAGAVTEFPAGVMPGGYVEGITAGPDGAIWFTEPVDARIGRITTAGAVTHVRVGAVGTRQPESITVGPDGNLWFTEAAGPRLGRLTPAGVLTEYPLSLADVGRPTQIARGPNRTIWFTSSPNQVVRVLLGPEVTTGTATTGTGTSARIAGTVDPFVSSTGYLVEYGRTTAYGSTPRPRSRCRRRARWP